MMNWDEYVEEQAAYRGIETDAGLDAALAEITAGYAKYKAGFNPQGGQVSTPSKGRTGGGGLKTALPIYHGGAADLYMGGGALMTGPYIPDKPLPGQTTGIEELYQVNLPPPRSRLPLPAHEATLLKNAPEATPDMADYSQYIQIFYVIIMLIIMSRQ